MQAILDDLDGIFAKLFTLKDCDQIQAVDKKLAAVANQLRLQEICQRAIIRINEGALPVRQFSLNVRALCDESEGSNSRWATLQHLDFNSLLFCLLAFSRLASLPVPYIDWLVANVPSYLEAQEFSTELIRYTQIANVLVKLKRSESTGAFLDEYHKRELATSSNTDERTRKRRRVADHLPLGQPLIMPLTKEAARIILEQTPDQQLVIKFPRDSLSSIVVPLHICTKIMRVYNELEVGAVI